MTSLRHFAAAALCTLGVSLPAAAGTTHGPDWTDLWWNPAESGWGINIIHQSNTLFATIFVYEGDRSPHWFAATEMNGAGNAYSGGLFQPSGPAYTGPWNGGVTVPSVGSISINFTSTNTATLSYTANGISVTKNIQRQTFRGNNLSGEYFGGLVATTNCSPPNVLAHGPFRVTHANSAGGGGTVTISLDFITSAGQNCTYTGAYTATGRVGSISGSYSCTAGPTNGTFTMTEVDAGRNGFNAIFSARDNLNCNYNGFFGGTKDQYVR